MLKHRPIRVLCVDDHGFLVDGLQSRFERTSDIEFVGRLPSAENLVLETRRLKPDVVLMDIEMPGPDPFESVELLRQTSPDVKVVFLTAYTRDHYIGAAIDAGASGYFSKSDEVDRIVQGIRDVMRGRCVFGPKAKARLQNTPRDRRGEDRRPATKLAALSNRETEILRMIGRGLRRSEIADHACISPKTVDNHREAIMRKLDVHDRGELVRFAIGEGLAEV